MCLFKTLVKRYVYIYERNRLQFTFLKNLAAKNNKIISAIKKTWRFPTSLLRKTKNGKGSLNNRNDTDAKRHLQNLKVIHIDNAV